MPYNGDQAVKLPSMFPTIGSVLQKQIDTRQHDKELDYERQYRLQKDKENDEWKKLNLIQDLTDLSKHQTSSDVANAIGNTVAGNVLQKYTGLAASMSPSELQANIQREMGGIVNGMEGAKNELDLADESLKQIKQLHPELDITSLAKDLRGDILNRRINHDSFVNPLQVKASDLRLDDPNVLSHYVRDTKSLDEEIANPQGLDPVSAVSGDPYTNVEYSAKVPSWMKPNYDESKMKNGFLPRGFMPQLSIKSEELPSDFLPALKGQQRKIVTPDVHQDFMAKHPLQVIAGTRSMFPNYDQMTEGEKELAQRDFLYGKIKSLDKSQFSYKSSKTPSASMIKIWQGGDKPSNVNVNELYGRIRDKVSSAKPGYGYPINQLASDEQDFVLSSARKMIGYPKLGQGDFYLKNGEDGKVKIFLSHDGMANTERDAPYVGELTYTGTNLGVQPSVKEKRAVIEKGSHQGTKPAKHNDPLGLLD